MSFLKNFFGASGAADRRDNLLQLFKHLDPEGGTLLPDLRRQVEARIQEEGWTTEGMEIIEIPTGA